MSEKYILFLFLNLMSFFVKRGTAIYCYDCNSLYDPRCGDEFDSFSLGVVNCSLRESLEHLPDLEPTVCRTIRMEVFNKVRVVRQCGYVRDDENDGKCQRRSGTHELFVTYCSCDTDLCNSTEKNTFKNPLLLTLICFMFFVF